jgi:hypothetical protein
MNNIFKEKIKKNIKSLKFLFADVFLKSILYFIVNILETVKFKKALFPVYLIIGIIIWFAVCNNKNVVIIDDEKAGIEAAITNYKDDVDKYADEFDLPSSYLMAVIILECSGRKFITPRFEKSIFKKLKQLRNKEIDKFENLTYETVRNADDDALKNLASSWGPFQLMGYKCTFLDIKLKEMRGDDAIYWGAKWIDATYGEYLRNGKFKDAFHIHNTGKEFPANGTPTTHDPEYVTKGLHYMEYFEKFDSINSK